MTHVAGASSEERRTRLFSTGKFQPIKGPAEVWDAARLDVTRTCLEAFATAAAGGTPYLIPTSEMVHGAAVTEAVVQVRPPSGKVETGMNLGKDLGHLTYSTLVHQTDDWDQLWKSVNTYLPAVKARMAPHEKFGVCLRTSAPSAATLSADPAKRAALKQFFADQDLYLYTANAFVYGVFKKQVIKEDVYEPDWQTPERRDYTKQVATLLAELAPEGVNPSIQSAPLGFKPKVTGDVVVEAYTTNVIDVVAHLVELEKKTGKTVTLGLEPEPRCYLETTDETITYFQDYLFAPQTTERLAKATGLHAAEAAAAMKKHMGIVFDIGHQSVGYEDIPASLRKLVAAGVPIVKLQEAASMHIPDVTQKTVDALQTFAKTIYLSQTCQKKDGTMTWFLNLEDAFEAVPDESRPAGVAHALPRAGVPHRPGRGVRHDPLRARAGAGRPQGDPALDASRDRDLHLGRAARPPQDRRHRRIRLPRDRVGQGTARIGASSRSRHTEAPRHRGMKRISQCLTASVCRRLASSQVMQINASEVSA